MYVLRLKGEPKDACEWSTPHEAWIARGEGSKFDYRSDAEDAAALLTIDGEVTVVEVD